MKTLLSLTCVVVLATSGCATGVVTRDQALGSKAPALRLQPTQGAICLIQDSNIAAPHQILGKVVTRKETYGSIDEVVPVFVKKVRSMGGNVVLSYEHGQKFRGPIASKAVVPQARGLVVFVENMDQIMCASLGGSNA